MRNLLDLIHTTEGLRFLESEGVFVDPREFKDQLKFPVKPDLAEKLGAGGRRLVCSGQQLYVDYQQSVLSKIVALRELEQDRDLFPFFLWVDTDRSGSDSLITKFAWPVSGKKGPITIMPPGTRDVEMRYARLDSAQLTSAIDKLETHLRQSGHSIDGAKERYQQLRQIFTGATLETLGQFNLRLTHYLLGQVYDYTPSSVLLSGLLDQGETLAEVDLFLNHLDEVVAVFNEAIRALVQKEVDPQVRPLAEHYLPLFYSCDADNLRLRLYHHREDGDHFAMAACKCGREYRFFLGRDTLSAAAITATGRWSPDVCFPIFFNDRVSGYVAGKSSTLYLMVMNRVLDQVLCKTPVPVLVPPTLVSKESGSPQDSLIYRYLANGHPG